MKIRLEKEPDNEYDKEAIKVTYEGLGKIGYVANSSYTVIGESMSAGRLYDKIGDTAYAKVVLVTPAGTICKICKKSLKSEQEETARLSCDRYGRSRRNMTSSLCVNGQRSIINIRKFETIQI